MLYSLHTTAQCPPNIGFETGSFDGWQCSIGSVGPDGSITVGNSDPSAGRHTIVKKSIPSLNDQYGHFPISCPNGSGYSIQLGNSQTGKQAERVSYTFTIPANQNNYSIIYNYAVVFQNPDHAAFEQPSFKANIYDVSTGSYIGCSSFSYTASANLPGFSLSTTGDKVFYKPWTPVTIKLSGYAGRTISLEFTTNDCTKGGHFGYAYIDVNQNCSSPISGNISCARDTAQVLTAPYGFSGYRWFNSDFSKLLGTNQNLRFSPTPPSGTKYAVEITPFPDQGCTDTVYTSIDYSSQIIDLKTPQSTLVSCITNPVDLTSGSLTAGSSPNLDLTYYADPNLVEYVSEPSVITKGGTYYIKAVNEVGCTVVKPVTVKASAYPVFKVSSPPPITRPNSFDISSTISGDKTGVTYTYWKDSLTTIPLPNPNAITRTGRYFIKASIEGGCSQIFAVNINVGEAILQPPNAFSPNGDGVHDTWEIPLLASLYADCTVDIYNRLGQKIFHSVGYATAWDGKYKGFDQPVGTYYYIIKARVDLPSVSGSISIVK
ncbi:MAG: gliding motility-associated C-terminal domain-containing protein [Sediminibacterium sp.]